PRRAGGGAQPTRDGGSDRASPRHPPRPFPLDPADRARHVGGDGDLRPRGGARLRPEDRRRRPRRGAQRPQGDRRLPRRRGPGGGQGRGGDRARSGRDEARSLGDGVRPLASTYGAERDRPREGSDPYPMLAVRGVKSFYGPIMALKGVDLDVHEGEIVTLI